MGADATQPKPSRGWGAKNKPKSPVTLREMALSE